MTKKRNEVMKRIVARLLCQAKTWSELQVGAQVQSVEDGKYEHQGGSVRLARL